MNYEVKPLGVGGILDQTIALLKNHFALFMLIMVCLQIPVGVVFRLMIDPAHLQPKFSANPTPQEMAAVLQKQMTYFLTFFVPFLLLMFFIVTPITNYAISHASARLYLGQPTGLRESMGRSLYRFGPYLWTWSLFSLIVSLGLAVCVLPGILLFFRFALALNVTVIEHRSGLAALRRSNRLMLAAGTSNYATLFLLALVIGVINYSVNLCVAYIPERHVAALCGALLQAVTVAFSAISGVVFYFSTRCKAENFDLMQLARMVGAPREDDLGPIPAVNGTGEQSA